MDMDLKIVSTLVIGNGVVLSIFYYAFTSKIKEIARNEAKETKQEFESFETKIETRLLAMDEHIHKNIRDISNLQSETSALSKAFERITSRIEQALSKIDDRVDKILERLSEK
jgi:predicted RNase H-like nuclease (RuvC/YqgF family)